jgi:hypothetical protein
LKSEKKKREGRKKKKEEEEAEAEIREENKMSLFCVLYALAYDKCH